MGVLLSFVPQIDAVLHDRTLTPAQRRVMIASLRQQQRKAAATARQSVIEAERAAARKRAIWRGGMNGVGRRR